MKRSGIFGFILLSWTIFMAASAFAEEVRVFFGSYDREVSERGIYAAVLNERTETLSKPKRVVDVSNPGFLCFSPDFQFLYVVCGEKKDSLAAFRVSEPSSTDDSLQLTEQNLLSGLGQSVCHLALDPSWQNILTAHYSSSELALFSLKEDHSLDQETQRQTLTGNGPNEKRQEKSHPHSVKFGSGNRFYVPDLGTDRIMIYQLDSAKHSFTPNEPAFVQCEAGSGPRHLCFLPDKKTVYAANELASTVTGFHVHRDGGLEAFQTISTLPADCSSEVANYPAEVACTPDGNFLYVSNRGHESLACFKIALDGSLILREIVSVHGKGPRHFAISPTGNFLIVANQDSANVVLFRIHPKTGKLTFLSEQTLPVSPVCVAFGPLSHKDAERELESLKDLKPEPVSPNWDLNGDFPWNATMKRLPKIKPNHFPEELILARMTLETLDDLQNFIKLGFEMEKLAQGSEDLDFVREITLYAVIQYSTILTSRFESLDQEKQMLLKPIVPEILKIIQQAIEWSPNEPSLLLCSAWMRHFTKLEKDSEGNVDVIFKDPEAKELLTRGIEAALKVDGGYAYPELLAKSLMARALSLLATDPEKAMADMDQASLVNPQLKDQVRDSKLILYVHQKKYDEALKLIDEKIEELKNLDVHVPGILQLDEDEEENEDSAQSEAGRSEISSGSEEVTEKLETEKNSSIFRLQCLRLEILAEMKQWEQILSEADALLKVSPENEELLRWKLQAFVNLDKIEEGIEILSQLLNKNSLDSNLYILRGQFFLAVDKPEAALEDFSEAISIEGFSQRAWDLKLSTLIQLNRTDDALKEVEDLLAKEPENAHVMIQAALIKIQKEEYSQALELGLRAEKAVEKKIAETPEADEETRAELAESKKYVIQFIANWYLMAGKHPEAKEYYEKFMELDDSDALVLNNYAWLLATSPEDSIRDGKKAIELAQKAVEIESSPTYLSTLAAAYAETGNFEEALKIVEEGIKKAENDPEILESLQKEKAGYEEKKPVRERAETYSK